MPIILRENEKLIKEVNRHFVFLLPPVLVWLLVVLALLTSKLLWEFDAWGYFNYVALGVLLIGFLIIWYKYHLWKNNVLILTDERIIQHVKQGLFSRAVTELLYGDILQVSYEKKGLRSHIYNYGNIIIRTAADKEIILKEISKPAEVVRVMNQIR
jgi:hypothetical protein